MLLEVGFVARAHGVRGEVVVDLLTDRTERLDPGSILVSDSQDLVVAAARRHHHRWIVSFEGVTDRSGAEALAGAVLRAEPLSDPDALWVHELIGALVRDQHGVDRGRVVAVEANPAHDLLVLDTGALVPVVFVTDSRSDLVTVHVPDGLFDLR